MNLNKKIIADITDAMKAKDAERLSTLADGEGEFDEPQDRKGRRTVGRGGAKGPAVAGKAAARFDRAV